MVFDDGRSKAWSAEKTDAKISDTINRLQRIDSTDAEGEQRQHYDYSYEANLKAKKFYAQRNLYLTGFTLFLSLYVVWIAHDNDVFSCWHVKSIPSILERTSTLVLQVLKREEELENLRREASRSYEKLREGKHMSKA